MKNKRSSHSIFAKFPAIILGLCVATFCGIHSAKATAETWTGATNGIWGTNTNWSSSAPLLTDTATILGPANAAGALTINVNAAANANLINFTDTSAVTLNNTTSGANQTLTIGAGGITVGTGAVTIGSSTANQAINVALGASQTWNVGSGGLTVNNVVSDGGSAYGITEIGTGTLTLAGANTYTGTTTINGGTLTLSGAISSSSPLSLGGGTLNYTKASATQTFNGAAINSGFSTVTNATAGQTVALGALTRSAGGILNVSSLTGATTTTTANDATGILGTWATEGVGTSLQYATGGGTIAAYGGATAATAANLSNVTSSSVNYSFAAATTQTGAITANTLRYTGGAVTWANGGFGVTLNGLMNAGTGLLTESGAGTITIGANKELVIVGNTQGTTIGSVIADNGGGASSLVYGGPSAGTLTLNGVNTYSGGTTLNAGTIQFGNTAGFGTGTITSNGGTLKFNYTAGSATSTNALVANSGTTNIDLSGNWTVNGNITGSGAIYRNTTANDSLYLGGSNGGFTGTFTNTPVGTNNTANLLFTSTNAGSATASWVFNNADSGKEQLNLTGTISFGSMTGAGTLTEASATPTISEGNLGLNDTFSGVIGTGIALIKVGTGALTLSGASTYTSAPTVENGSLVAGAAVTVSTAGPFGNASSAIALGDATSISSATAMNPQLLIGGPFTMARSIAVGANTSALGNGSTTFTIGGNTDNNSTFSGNIALDQNLTVSQVATTGGHTLTISGTISSASSAQGVTFAGPGSMTLSAANTYTGATNINAGTLTLSGTLGSGSGGGTAISNGATFTESSTGVIAGTSSLTNTAGTTTLSGVNTYTGATLVSGGTLTLSGAGSINGSSGITINGSGAKLLQTSSVASTPAITLTQGTLAGTTTVGAVTVGAGTGGILANGNGTTTALTLGSLTFNGAATLNLNTAGSAALAITGALTTTPASGQVTLNVLTAPTWSLNTPYNIISYGSFGGANTDFTLGSIAGLATRQSGILGNTGAGAGDITVTISGDNPVWTGTATNSGGSSYWTTAATNSSTSANPNWTLKVGHTTTDFWAGDTAEFDDTANLGGSTVTPSTSVVIHGGNVSPTAVNFNANTLNYTISSDDGSGIAGAALVNTNGSGTVTIDSSNSYTGSTTVNSGKLVINSPYSIGTGTLVINGGTLDSGSSVTLSTNNAQHWNGDFAFAGTTNVNLGTGAVTLGASRTVTLTTGTLTVGGAIGDGGNGYGITLPGSGTLVLNGTDAYSGTTAINGGLLQLGNANAVQNSTVSIGVNNGLAFTSGIDTVNLGGLSGSGNEALADTGAAGVTLSVGGNSASTVYSGALSGAGGALTKVGTGTLTLNGTNTYGGATTISNGALQLGNANALQNSAVAINAANGLAFSPGIGTFNIVNLSGAVSEALADTSGSAVTLSIGATNLSGTYSGGFTGIGALAKVGSGTLALNGSSSYSGGTNLNAGIINLGNGNGLGTGTLNLSGGSLQWNYVTGSATVSNNIQVSGSGSQINTAYGNVILNGTLSGSGYLTIGNPGALASDYVDFVANTMTSGTITMGGGGAQAVRIQAVTAGNANVAWIVTNNVDGRNEVGGGGTISFGSLTGNGFLTVDAGTTVSAGALGLNDLFSGVMDNGGGLTKVGTGKMTLTGLNTYSGGTTLNAGTLQLGSTNAIGSGTLTINGGALDSSAANLVNAQNNVQNWKASFGFIGTQNLNLGTGAVTLNTSPTVTVNSNTLTVGGAIGDSGSGYGITVAGSGTLVLNGSNTFSGPTNITGGTLQLGSGGATGSLSTSSAITDNGNLTFDRANTVAEGIAFNGAGISGTGGLTQAGGGALILTASESYTGPTAISAGTLQLGNGGTTGSLSTSSAITDNGNLTFDRSNPVAQGTDFSGAGISGGGSLTQSGSGTLTLSGSNSYSGGTTINSGIVQINSAASLGLSSGAVTMNPGSTLEALNGITTSRNFSLSGDPTIQVDNGTYEIDGAVTDGTSPGTLVKTGTGILNLTSSTDNYSGGTFVNQGTLIASGALSGTGTVTVNSGATLGGLNGSITGNVNIETGGTLYPSITTGTSNQQMTIGGNLTLSDSANMTVNLTGTGTSNIDFVKVNGVSGLTLSLNPSALDTLTVNLLADPAIGQMYDFLYAPNGYTGSFATSAILTGVDAGLFTATVGYDSGSSSLEVQFTAVPEPGTWATMVGGMGMLIAFQRIRRQSSVR